MALRVAFLAAARADRGDIAGAGGWRLRVSQAGTTSTAWSPARGVGGGRRQRSSRPAIPRLRKCCSVAEATTFGLEELSFGQRAGQTALCCR